ncbi:hypothetical protein EDC01DRAFT_774942 [Geopyxis carbonaria]|nr:hypothetical protein EDC01DRAFT_774942 [Geopyxis carbonaria]
MPRPSKHHNTHKFRMPSSSSLLHHSCRSRVFHQHYHDHKHLPPPAAVRNPFLQPGVSPQRHGAMALLVCLGVFALLVVGVAAASLVSKRVARVGMSLRRCWRPPVDYELEPERAPPPLYRDMECGERPPPLYRDVEGGEALVAGRAEDADKILMWNGREFAYSSARDV